MPIAEGSKVLVTKGCNARGISKGSVAVVQSVENMGAEYSHCVRVVLRLSCSSKTFAFYARHVNRLSDAVVRMNDGNPTHVIEVRAR